ncbi:MAG: Signal peptidase I [bacterium ADurb.Bin429]|nr:MAG: Signal peptidase I [bacterium ADurb.Bin429]
MSPASMLLSRILLALENPWVVFTCVVITLGIRLIYQAYRRANPLPAPKNPAPPPYRVQPVVEGVLFFLAFVVAVFVGMKWGNMPGIIAGVLFAFAAYGGARDYFGKAKLTGKWAERLKDRPHKDGGLEFIDTLLIALILVFGIVRPFLLQTFFIPSASMEPTLLGPYDPKTYDGTSAVLVQDDKRRSGDKLLANRFVLRFRPPRRGEVIIFKPSDETLEGLSHELRLRRWATENPKDAEEKYLPALNTWRVMHGQHPLRDVNELLATLPTLPDPRDDYIKRVVAVPGDRIRVSKKDLAIYLNGSKTPLEEPYIPDWAKQVTMDFPERIYKEPDLIPTLKPSEDGTVTAEQVELFLNPYVQDNIFPAWLKTWYDYHVLYEKRLKPYIVDGGEFQVPDNAVLVMGDNRGGSYDSRFWGVVPLEDIKGRAVATFWPPHRLKLL